MKRLRKNLSWPQTSILFALTAAVAFTGCGVESRRSDEPVGSLNEAATIDPTIKLSSSTLPGTNDSLAAVEDENKTHSEFVDDELIISTDDATLLSKIMSRYKGVEVDTAKPVMLQNPDTQIPLPPTIHLIRIDPTLGDPSMLDSNVMAILNTQTKPQLRASSSRGLGTLAAAADVRLTYGVDVGLRFKMNGSDLAHRSTTEGTTSGAPGGYSSSAYNWSYAARTSGLATGVGEAWTALNAALRLPTTTSSRVGLAVIDQGFVLNSDFLTGATAVSNIPGRAALNMPNLMGCSGGTPCPWHGSGVTMTAMGLADNGFGAAGPAGPVARPILVSSLYDMFSANSAIILAVANGARIVNMSYGIPLGWAIAWMAAPFNRTTDTYRRLGILFFASAGNDNTDVDASCGWVGECTMHVPCENDGVICVGAINPDAPIARTWYTNFGSSSTGATVDLFAPGTEFVGPMGATTGPVVTFGGTSAASPFAAGVAALIWASRPTLRADDVENLLLGAARPSTTDWVIRRVVNAYDAVLNSMGTGFNTVNSCTRPLCVGGTPLTPGCDAVLYAPFGGAAVPADCVRRVVAADSYCGTTGWDGICVNEARSICGVTCN